MPEPNGESSRTLQGFPVLVIGAGPAGLAAMRALKESGIPFQAVERHGDVGGMWDQRNADSPAYDGLVTNASKATMSLGDPFPRGWPAYLPRDLAHRYLVDYGTKHGLKEFIEFRTSVIAISKSGGETWMARLREETTGTIREREFRAVVMASGFHSTENIRYPHDLWAAAEANGIRRVHSARYRNTESYRGKTVLVCGTGNSGAEIATAIGEVAAKTFLVVRTTPWIVPLWVGPIPTDVFARWHVLPRSLEMMLFRWLQKILVGHPTRDLGFPPLEHELLERLPVSNRGIVDAIKKGKVVLRSSIKEIKDGKVFFEDPNHSPQIVQEVIFATGYLRRFPFLPVEYGDFADPAFHPMFHLFHPTEPGLIFLPEMTVPQGTWPLFWEQARTIAAYLVAEGASSSSKVDEFNLRRRTPSPIYKKHIFRLADEFHVDPEVYTRLLREFRRWILA